MDCNTEYFNQNYPTHDLEEVLKGLREMGASQMETAFLLCRQLQLKVREADEMVLNSDTWQDMKEATIQLREDIWDALNLLKDEL